VTLIISKIIDTYHLFLNLSPKVPFKLDKNWYFGYILKNGIINGILNYDSCIYLLA